MANGLTSELNFLKRGLSGPQIAGLKGLAESSADNWWKEVLESKDLLLAVRNGYLNAYVKGQSVFKICLRKRQQPAPPCDPLQVSGEAGP
jgi:hypothetical protein